MRFVYVLISSFYDVISNIDLILHDLYEHFQQKNKLNGCAFCNSDIICQISIIYLCSFKESNVVLFKIM